ncbi:hypothetical protein VaNZ11_005090, partial [Volvox africanus]
VACTAAVAAVLALAVVFACLVLARHRCSSCQYSRNPHQRCGALFSKHVALVFSRHITGVNAGADAANAAEGGDTAAPNVASGGDIGGGGGGGLVSDCLLDSVEEQRRRQRRRRLRGADDEGVEAPLPPSDHCYSLFPGPPNLFVAVAAREGTSAVSATAAAAPGTATWSSAIIALPRSPIASYAPGDAVSGACAAATATATAAIGGSSNANGDHSCVFLGLDPGQGLTHGSASLMPQDVGPTGRRCGRLSPGATSLTSSPSIQQPLSLRGLGVTVGASGCGRSASVVSNCDGVGVSGSSYDDLLSGNRTTSPDRFGSGVNIEDLSSDRGGSGCDDGAGHRQYRWYGISDGSVGSVGGDGHTRNDGNRQSVSDSNSALDSVSSFNAEDESEDGGGGVSAAVSPGAAGLAAVTAAIAELDGSSKRRTASQLGGLSTPNSQLPVKNQQSINAPQLRLEGVLGCGSWGTVYRGTWNGLAVAVKTLVFSAAADDDARRRALREATLSASVSHPNIISIYSAEVEPLPGGQWSARPTGLPATALAAVGAGGRLLDEFAPPPPPTAATAAAALPSLMQTAKRRLSASAIGEGSGSSGGAGGGGAAIMDWRLYIIQEFADAGPLAEVYGDLDMWPLPGAPNLPSVVALALGITSALSYLHSKRIIHGDLNPNNVLLKRDSREPSGLVVKVADFGLSVMLPKNRSHLSNLRMGTMFYVCPTVVMKAQVGPASDVFSLGVILWELYHGRRAGIRTAQGPRYSSIFPAFPPACPEAYRAIALHCLQRQPQNRPSAAQVEQQLHRLLETVAAPAAPTALSAEPPSPTLSGSSSCRTTGAAPAARP